MIFIIIMKITNKMHYLDDWLTVHRSITLFDLQLDAQILIYLQTRQLPAESDDTRGCIYTITT